MPVRHNSQSAFGSGMVSCLAEAYLEVLLFVIKTYQALKWIHDLKEAKGRSARWRLCPL